jgi:C4-type Zn-finger protein
MAANVVLQYDPKAFSLILGGNIISGFADDSFVSVERDMEAFTKKTGVDGITTRAKNNVQTGKVTIRLMQSSASNDVLSNLALLDEASSGGIVPLTAKDGSGRSIFSSESAWVQKMAKSEWKKDTNENEWVIDCGALAVFVGGN